jgi:hypothetical protein
MDTLIQSLSEFADRTESLIHVRYLERKGDPVDHSGNGKSALEASKPDAGDNKRKSIVVIRQAYVFLESTIATMFEDAEDVRVIVDRRYCERRRESVPGLAHQERRNRIDRRNSSPMLDILINVNA